MADFFGELAVELLKLILQVTFEPCHTQRGCVLSLLTLLAFVGGIGFLVAAGVLGQGNFANLCLTLAGLSGILFFVGGLVMFWSKCVDEPK